MASRRKLEEEIARTKDPQLRKQLQELLGKRKQRRKETAKNVKEGVDSLGKELVPVVEEAAKSFSEATLVIFPIAIILLLILWILGII